MSKLYNTWMKQHQEKTVMHTENGRWQNTIHVDTMSTSHDNDEEYQRLLKTKEDALGISGSNRQKTVPVPSQTPPVYVPTKGERERESAIWHAIHSIRDFVKSPFRTEFYPYDLEDVLPQGIVAKVIDMESREGASFGEDNLTAASLELVEMVECGAERANAAIDALKDVVLDIALPDEVSSLGIGGGGSNDLPKKKDDEWEWWKKNGFVRPQRSRGIKR